MPTFHGLNFQTACFSCCRYLLAFVAGLVMALVGSGVLILKDMGSVIMRNPFTFGHNLRVSEAKAVI